jgi:predicted nucleic acid-binding protein
MAGTVFVDSNVLVYSRDASEAQKQQQALKWMTHLWTEKNGRLSYQVLNEFYVTVTQKLQPGMNRKKAREDVRFLLAWRPIIVDATVIKGAWRIQDQYTISWWDALIISAAQAAKCRYLLSEDLQENQTIGTIKIINPFHTEPEELPEEHTSSR